MKSLKCDLCDHVAEGETFEDWMTALRPHYLEAHADVMQDLANGQSREGAVDDRQQGQVRRRLKLPDRPAKNQYERIGESSRISSVNKN